MLQEVLRSAGCTASIARVLERKGLVEIAPAQNSAGASGPQRASRNPPALVLTASQKEVFDRILGMIAAEARPARCLLHGVTGSGKTEIYLRLIGRS